MVKNGTRLPQHRSELSLAYNYLTKSLIT